MGDLALSLGQNVQSHDGRQGIVRFLGATSFAKGEWLGLELPDEKGKNDGSVNGERYFECQPGFGIFVRPESIVRIVSQGLTIKSGKTNGTVAEDANTKPRPSSGTTAHVARRKQSLLDSSAPPPALGSRSSLRSPTKSPTKPLPSSASSGRSTPQSITPTTTLRTSDSSTKSRMSASARTSMGPPPRPSSSKQPRQSIISFTGINSRSSTPLQPSSASRSKHADPLGGQESSEGSSLRKDNAVTAAVEEEEENNLTPARPPSVQNTQEINSVNWPPVLGGEQEASTEHRNSMSSQSGASRSFAQESRESKAIILEMEQLKSKIRTLERKRQEDREKLRAADELQVENSKFAGIIQALQKKLQSSQKEIAELRQVCKDAESRANQVEKRGAEHDSELEMATLDREMAEERAEAFKAELDTLKREFENLHLEVDVLREENQEIGLVLNPEEKASSGWLQMERERDKYYEALLSLRDITKQQETNLGSQIKELEKDLVDYQSVRNECDEVKKKLSQEESKCQHWKAQLEAVESQEEINLNLENENETYRQKVEELKYQVHGLQEEVQVNNEIEFFHLETERDLQAELDAKQAKIREQEYRTSEQDQIISELDYTLSRFRDLVSNLQSDIDDLRATREISESEATEITTRSRAIMDLHLKLHNSAAKARLKTIDVELGRMLAGESAQHLSILQMFLPETYYAEKSPIDALLSFKRIHSKVSLINSVLQEQVADLYQSTQYEGFALSETLEKLVWIASMCSRFVDVMSSCSIDEFTKCGGALYELEPAEKALDGWIDALKGNENNRKDGDDELRRMIALLSDLADNLIPIRLESRAGELIASTNVVKAYCESAAMGLGFITDIVQKYSSTTGDEDEARHFKKKIDQLAAKSRTIKFVTGKTHDVLRDLQSRSMLPGEAAWSLSADVEQSARDVSEFVRLMGKDASIVFSEENQEETCTQSRIQDLFAESATKFVEQGSPEGSRVDDAMSMLGTKLQNLHSKVEDLYNRAGNIREASEFERRTAPWIARSQELKDLKIVNPEAEEQLQRLRADLREQVLALVEKDRQLEEQGMRVEVLEARNRDTRNQAVAVRSLEAELEAIRRSQQKMLFDLEKATNDYKTLLRQSEEGKSQMEALRKAQAAGDISTVAGTGAAHDETAAVALAAEVHLLTEELANLQSVVRFLKAENRRAKIPPSPSAFVSPQHSWLDPSSLSRPRALDLRGPEIAESQDFFRKLLDMATNAKPVVLEPIGEAEKISTWRSAKSTPRYQVMKQREELEEWSESKQDLLNRFRVGSRVKHRRVTLAKAVLSAEGKPEALHVKTLKPNAKILQEELAGGIGSIEIVDSSL